MLMYDLLTRTKEIKFERLESRHQHTFVSLLFTRFSDFDKPGPLQSIIWTLIRNPWICDLMPKFDFGEFEGGQPQMHWSSNPSGDGALTPLLHAIRKTLQQLARRKLLLPATIGASGGEAPCTLPLCNSVPADLIDFETGASAWRLPMVDHGLPPLDEGRRAKSAEAAFPKLAKTVELQLELPSGSAERPLRFRRGGMVKGFAERYTGRSDQPSTTAPRHCHSNPCRSAPLW